MKRFLVLMGLAAGLVGPAAHAQSNDWNGNFQFRSAAERLVDLRQAVIIDGVESGRIAGERRQVLAAQALLLSGGAVGFGRDDFYARFGGRVGDGSGDYWSGWGVEVLGVVTVR